MTMALIPNQAKTEKVQHSLLLDGLEDMYHHQALTDCVLVVGSCKLPCHRLVLAASSPYFRAMFTSKLSETNQEEIELHNVEAEAMQQILEYIYTALIDINDNNVQSIFTAGNLFEILDLCSLCSNYMAQELCIANCISVYQFASFHNCSELKKTSHTFVINHFNEVIESPELLSLSADDLAELLSDDNLNVTQEEHVYDCLIKWTEYDLDQRSRNFVKLFKLVRFTLISDDFMEEKVLPHELVLTNSFCRSIITVSRLYKATQSEEMDSTILDEMQLNSLPRLGMYNRSMMVFVGGSQEAGKKRAFTCFDPKTRKNYYAIPLHVSFDFKYRIDHHRITVTDRGEIYLVGGIFYEDHHFEESGSALQEVMMFDDYRKSWIECANLQTPRCAHTLVHHDGLLFAIGGKAVYPNGEPLASVECYDTVHDEWRYVRCLPYGLYHHGSVVYNGKIYVIGGFTSENQATNTFLEYDPLLDTWSSIARKLHTPRGEFGLVLLHHCFYVIGGCTSEHKLSTVEIYDFQSNSWKFGTDFPEDRKSMAAVIYDGCIYICGGVRTIISRMNRTQRVVETKDLWRYDPQEKVPQWTREVKLVQYANIHACVVTEINTKRVQESEFISR